MNTNTGRSECQNATGRISAAKQTQHVVPTISKHDALKLLNKASGPEIDNCWGLNAPPTAKPTGKGGGEALNLVQWVCGTAKVKDFWPGSLLSNLQYRDVSVDMNAATGPKMGPGAWESRPGARGKRPKTLKTYRNSGTLPRPEGGLHRSPHCIAESKDP